MDVTEGTGGSGGGSGCANGSVIGLIHWSLYWQCNHDRIYDGVCGFISLHFG